MGCLTDYDFLAIAVQQCNIALLIYQGGGQATALSDAALCTTTVCEVFFRFGPSIDTGTWYLVTT